MNAIIYEGRRYRSVRSFCKERHVNYEKMRYCLSMGMSADESVKKIEEKRYHLNGKNFSSRQEIANELGISRAAYNTKNEYAQLRNQISPAHNPFLFRGVTYESKDAFYQALGMTSSGVRKYAIRHGISKAEAIERVADQRLGIRRK